MPAKNLWITHLFAGGWATDFGPTVYTAPDQSNIVQIPFLINARNCVYEFDGGPRKMPGFNQFNSGGVYGGASGAVVGLYDFWRQGTAGTPTQRLLCASDNGSNLLVGQAAISDTSFTDLITNFTTGAVPQFSTFDDLLIATTDNTSDTPRSWDGTTMQNLAGTPPRFSFSVPHKNRQWAAGVFANPSTLYYSENVNPEDWTGAGAGSIQIDPNDGDMITGIISHKDDLWVFKGPNTGSIHRITGSAPTGSDAFARIPFIRGLGAGWQNGIFRYGDDIGFISPFGTIHSLAATSAYGDFVQSYLSYPINSYIREGLNFNRIRYWTATNDPTNGRVYIHTPLAGASTNTAALVMDYRFMAQGERYPRWSSWDSIALGSSTMVRDSNSRRRVYFGGYTGRVWSGDQSTRSLDGTAASFQVTLPHLNYSMDQNEKTISAVGIGVLPRNSNNMTFGWQRDNQAQQTATVAQGGGVLLGTFLLGTDTLGGGRFVNRYIDLEEGGTFRSIQLEVTDGANNSDIEVHSIMARIINSGESTEND